MKRMPKRPERSRTAVDAWAAWEKTQDVTLPMETAMLVMRAFAAGFDAGWYEHTQMVRPSTSTKPHVQWTPVKGGA
jgi:hypothetical protein